MLPVKIGEAIIRHQLQDLALNNECMKTELDLLDERREKAKIKGDAYKQRVARRYNAKVKPRNFQKGHLVWRMTSNVQKDAADGKFVPNSEGPYRVHESLGNGAVRLEHLDGE